MGKDGGAPLLGRRFVEPRVGELAWPRWSKNAEQTTSVVRLNEDVDAVGTREKEIR